MSKKTGFIKLIRLWGVVFLMALAGVIVGIDLFTTYHDFNIRMDNMRTDYVEQQKKASKREVERVVTMINNERTQSEALAKKEIKSRVLEACSIAQNIYEQNKALKSDAEIQKMIVDALTPIRFNDAKGFYFIHSLSGENILDPTYPSGEGQNIINLQDSRGEYVVKKELKLLSEKEEGFLIGYWPKPDRDPTKDFKKIAFVKIFKPYNWSIGTGLYVDDIEEQIKATWMERINHIHFGKNLVGYLFAVDWRGKSLAHGTQPDLIGNNGWEYKDSRGNKTTQLLIAASKKKDGGYTSFWWRKPDTGKESSKIAYAKAVPEWELFVGSGVYTDDIEQNITTLRAALNAQTKTKILIFIIIVAIAFTLFFILFNLLSNRLRKDFNLFVSCFDKAAFSDKKIDRETVHFVELDQLAEYANKMLQDKINAQQDLWDEREQSEKKIRLLSSAVQQSSEGTAVADLEGNIMYANHAWADMHGYESSEELVGQSLSIFHNQEQLEAEVMPFNEKAIAKGFCKGEVGHIRRDGTPFPAMMTTSIIKDENGKNIALNGLAMDITDRKQAEEALHKTTTFLNSIIDQSPFSIWISDSAGTMIRQNQACRDLLNITDEDVVGKYNLFQDNITEEQGFMPLVRSVFEEGKVARFVLEYDSSQLKHVTLDRTVSVSLEIAIFPIKNVHGKITNALIEHNDITERKMAEDKLLENEQKFMNQANFLDSVIENSPFGMHVMDAKGVIIRANQALRDILNVTDDMIVGKYNVLHDENMEAQKLMPVVEAVFNDLKSARFIMFWTGSKAGDVDLSIANEHWIDVAMFPITDEAGKLVNAVCQYVEITERKQAEEALRINEEKLNQIINSSPVGICTVDMLGNFITTNPEYERMVGYAKEELVGLSFYDVTHPNDRPKNKKLFQDMFSLETTDFSMEKRYIRKDGEEINVSVHAIGIRDAEGNVRFGTAFVEDITERKQAEEQIKELNRTLEQRIKDRTRQLETVNNELESFAYSVSHDLRAPLRSMDGFSVALLEDYADKFDDQGKDYLQRVRNASKRMAQLIDGILELSRTTRSEVKWERINLSALTKSIMTDLHKSQPERRVGCIIEPDLYANGDVRLLRAAIQNLLDNAFKFTGRCDQGKIEFGVLPPSETDESSQTPNPTYFIRDNGAGFDMTYADKLFGVFQRLHGADEFPGTGVGLATVERILHRHGGRIWAEAGVDEGATFYFTLG